jgi:hypothetical protein
MRYGTRYDRASRSMMSADEYAMLYPGGTDLPWPIRYDRRRKKLVTSDENDRDAYIYGG